MPLTIHIAEGPAPKLALVGRLDTESAPELDRALDKLLQPGRKIPQLVFDLGKLDYLSSAGIRCFVRARKAIEPGGGKVALVNPQPAVRKVLEIVKAMPRGGIFASVAELDAYLDEMQKKVGHEDD
jgi:anti-anti-sigma factor